MFSKVKLIFRYFMSRYYFAASWNGAYIVLHNIHYNKNNFY